MIGATWPSRVALTLCAAFAAPAGAQHGPPATPVVAAPITVRDVPAAMRLVGTVRPDKQASIASEMDGIVASYPAQEGAFLKTGELICALDPVPAELALAEAQAELARLKAQLDELVNGVRTEILTRLEAAVGEAQARFDFWKYERDRIADLFAKNQSSDKERNDTESEFLASERRLAQAAAAFAEARNGARPEELARARQAVAVQDAIVRRAERNLRLTQVVAPFDGFVVAKHTEIGEWIEKGGPVCELVAIDTVKVRADAPESVVPFAVAGADARVEFEALGLARTGKVARNVPMADSAARTFPVEIDLENKDHKLLPGMFVWAYVPAGPPGERLMAPKDAIVPQGQSKTIFVVRASPDGTMMAMPTPVTTGLELAGEVEVAAAGLAAGDLVVTRANERLFGPSPVQVVGNLASANAGSASPTSAPDNGHSASGTNGDAPGGAASAPAQKPREPGG